MNYKLIIDWGFNVRFNINDKNILYIAENDTSSVNSKSSLLLSLKAGYKLFETKKMMVIPKLGLGIEVINTGIRIKSSDGSYESFDVETACFSLGVSFLTPVLKRNYLGINFDYRFCPYGLDENLITKLDNNMISGGISYRF